jgi:hypothetical protein
MRRIILVLALTAITVTVALSAGGGPAFAGVGNKTAGPGLYKAALKVDNPTAQLKVVRNIQGQETGTPPGQVSEVPTPE